MKKPLKIAFFNALDQASGAEQLIRKTVEGLNEKGCEARMYTREIREPKPYIFSIPYLPKELKIEKKLRILSGRLDYFFPSTWLLNRDPWLRNADIWQFHNLHGHYASFPALSWHSRRRKIVISPVDEYLTTGYCPYTLGCERFRTGCGVCPQLQLPYPGISWDATSVTWKMKRKAIQEGKFHYLLHTDYMFDLYRSALNPDNQLDMQQISYGVDIQINRPMDREDCAKQLGIPRSQKFVVGLFHSFILDSRKPLLPLLEKLQTISKKYSGQIEVLVVGRNSEQAKALETPDQAITCLPFLKTELELAQALNLCDVLLYPTRGENLALTCLCSLACGVPVITSNIGGQPEAVKDGVTGFLTTPGNQDEILAKLENLFHNPSLRKEMSTNARKIALEKYDMSVYVERLIQYYENIRN